MNHNLLTSKITKKGKTLPKYRTLCMTILFFQNDVAILIPSPRWVFFCMPKTIKSIISWNEFWNETLWLFFTNKKNWWIFLQLFRVSRYKTIQTSKKKTLKQTNSLTLSWLRFLGWSKNAMNLFLFITTTTNRLLINNHKVKISRNSNFH